MGLLAFPIKREVAVDNKTQLMPNETKILSPMLEATSNLADAGFLASDCKQDLDSNWLAHHPENLCQGRRIGHFFPVVRLKGFQTRCYQRRFTNV
jgi:hypothetical protein